MKKLEVLFSVFLVVVLVVPNLSLGAWTTPPGPFSIISPDPDLPISQSVSPEAKPGYISLPQLKLEDVGTAFAQPDSLKLNLNNSISWGIGNNLTVGIDKILNFTGDGIKLPSLNVPSNPVAGTIYYDSVAKEVKLHDGSTWKSIGSGGAAAAAGSSQWSDISGNIAYGFSKTIPNPRHNGLVIKNDKATRDQFCIEDASAADSVKYTSGDSDEIAKGSVTHALYNNGWSTATGNISYLTSIVCNSGNRVGIGTVSPGYSLDVNGSINGSQICIAGVCKSAWPVAGTGGSSQWKDLTGGIYYNSGSVSIGSNEPKAALRVSGGTNQLYIDSDTGTYLDGAGGGYNQSEPIVFHVGGAQLIARNADFDGTNWKRAKYGTVSAIAFGGGDERNDAPAGDIQFLTAPYGDAGSNIGTFKNVLSIKNNGNVGIGGEPDSKYKFDVKSGYINLGDASSEVMIPGGATLDEGLLVRSGGLIVSGGNVGIGTDSPKEKLHVSKGNILVQSGHVLFETFQPADPQAISVFSLSGSGSLTGSNITYTATYGSEFGETQAAPTPTFGTVNPNNGKVKITLNEPVDPRITHYYVYRSTNGNSGPFFLIKKLEISKLEKEGSYYVYTDSGDTITLPPKNPPPYSTFAAGFQLKSEQDSSYTQILRMMKTNNGSVFMGINTDRPSELFEVVGVGSTPVRALDPTGGKIGRIRITDTLNNPELQLQYGTNPTDHWGIYVNRDLDSGGPALQFWAGGNNALTVYQSGAVSASRIIGTNLTAQNANLVNLNFDNAQTGGKKVYSIMGGGGCGNYTVRETCYSFGSGSLDPGILDKGACSVGNIQYLTKPYNNVAQFVFLCMY